MIRKLFGWIFNRWVMAILGLIAIGLLIWFVGPLISIAGYAPLDPVWIRTTLIVLIVVVYVGRIVIKLIRSKLANRSLMDSLAARAQPKSDAAPGPGAEEVALLGKRFQEATAILKRTKFGGGKQGLAARLGLGRQYIYELPWYMIIGAPGSGKTTALLNAGLRFPLNERLGKDALAGVGGTRNCDWWFTDQAVLLDTAGRYTTQDSDAGADQAAWRGFLALLKRHRPRRPINGVLVAISVQDLLEANAAQRDNHARKIRARVQELHEQIGIRFPIYVLITKTDLLAGFSEFFAETAKEEREQVWGLTFAYNEQAAETNPLPELPTQLQALERRLNERLFDRLQSERDPQKRAAIYLMPQQWSALRTTLSEFLNEVFAPSRFEERPLVRGVYFTSGTQEGMPIDRLVGGLARALGLGGRASPAQRATGRSYFLTRLLQEVVFAESGLAGTNLKWERRRSLLQWGAIAAALVVSIAMIIIWTISYSSNRTYVASVNDKVKPIAAKIAELPPKGTDIVGLLPVLRAVRDLASAAPAQGERVPISMGFGLYQGEMLGDASRIAYQRLLRDAMAPRLSARIAEMLQSGGQGNAELYYEALKTYLMLHDPKRFDSTAVKSFVLTDWDVSLGGNLSIDDRKDLESHLDTLLTETNVVSPYPLDQGLVARARAALAQTPLASRAYNRVKRLMPNIDPPEFTVATAGGPQASLAFARKSRQPLTRGVPGLYSYDAFHKHFQSVLPNVTKQLADEAEWVLGEPQGARAAAVGIGSDARLKEETTRLYLQDYARTWEAFIKDIQVQNAGELKRGMELAQVLGSTIDNPLPRLFRAVVREVTLAQTPEAEKTIVDKGIDRAREKKAELDKILGRVGVEMPKIASTASLADQIVDQNFAGLRRMVTPPAPGQKAPIDEVVSLMNELSLWAIAADSAIKQKISPPSGDPIVNKMRAEVGRIPDPISTMVSQLVQEIARIVARGGQNIVVGEMRELAEFCRSAIVRRYPLAPGATEEVRVDDFSRFFSPGGSMDSFFRAKLESIVDTSTRPWSFRPGPGGTGNEFAAALPQFQRAKTIRDVFFRSGGPAASIRLEFKPIEMDAAITNFILDVDGQLVRYSHGPQVMTAVNWPGSGGRKMVRMEISPPPPSGTSAASYQGDWALFRLFERSKMQSAGAPERFTVTFEVEGRRIQFEVATSSVQNPFRLSELTQFGCPA